VLIDFGYSKKILDEAGKHITRESNQTFVGNYAFASHNAFLGKSLSRRDDLISLCYLMSHLLDGEAEWLKNIARSGLSH
jgi:hypothetical protein